MTNQEQWTHQDSAPSANQVASNGAEFEVTKHVARNCIPHRPILSKQMYKEKRT
jgi:hypothetical protein